MPDPRRYRATSTALGTPHPGQQLELRHGWAREFQAAAVLLCAGLMVLPALATLNFVVWLGYQDLDRTACLVLLRQPSE